MTPGLLLRSFVALLLAAAPPALGVLAAVGWLQGPHTDADVALVFGVLVLASIAWITLVAVVYSRDIRDQLAAVLQLAERGDPSGGEGADSGDAIHRRVTSALEERNRQVAELASQISRAPIGDDPQAVTEHVVAAARSVTRDPTWVLAVLQTAMQDRLPPGVYEGGGGPAVEIGELHRWASVAIAESFPARVGRVEGPWGAFIVISLAASDELRAILLAPWEGRTEPSSAELALLSLVGEHAATAIDHAILYARVQSQAEAIDRMASVQRDFLRAVTHDLQTPLTSIRAAASEIKAQHSLDEQGTLDLDLIEHQADRLRRMVAQLLAVSRLDAGVVEPQLEVLNPRPVIERTWAALRADDRQMEILVDGPDSLVVADPDRFEQVLWAILDNAVKYSPAGGDIRVLIGAHPGRAVLSVTDKGMGMDPETVANAFAQFFRAANARRLAPDGSGIGLYAARGLMEAMGGSIAISSQLGEGTTVSLELPAELIDDDVASAQHDSA